MNTHAAIIPSDVQVAAPYAPARYEAFRVCEATKGYSARPRTTYALGDLPAATLDEALNAALAKSPLAHKEHLAIRETDEHGARVHLFAIKRKSQPTYRYVGHEHVRQHDLYAAPVCVMEGKLFG